MCDGTRISAEEPCPERPDAPPGGRNPIPDSDEDERRRAWCHGPLGIRGRYWGVHRQPPGGCPMSVIIRAAGASALAALSLVGTAAPAGATSGARAPAGHLVVVQAVPKQSLDVAIDGHAVGSGSTTGA